MDASKRSVLGCVPLLHRIFFFSVAQCVPAVKSQVWYIRKNLKLYKIEFFLCALMTHIQNIERNFTFTGKRTDNEEQNEMEESLSDSNEELADKSLFD